MVDAGVLITSTRSKALGHFPDLCWPCNKTPGAPSFAPFAKGGINKFRHKLLRIPPFANNAKDGAPGVLLHGQRKANWDKSDKWAPSDNVHTIVLTSY
jgi:hypothetical protein